MGTITPQYGAKQLGKPRAVQRQMLETRKMKTRVVTRIISNISQIGIMMGKCRGAARIVRRHSLRRAKTMTTTTIKLLIGGFRFVGRSGNRLQSKSFHEQ